MSKKNNRIAILGGGAAGLMAAVCAAQNPNTNVIIYEAAPKIGKSILKTGNGRCNFSNTNIILDKGNLYNHIGFVNNVFENADSKISINPSMNATLYVLKKIGLIWHEDIEGRLFPITNKASSVVDVFRLALNELNVKIKCEKKIKQIEKHNNVFTITFVDGKQTEADKVIVCTGGATKIKFIHCGNLQFVLNSKVLGPVVTNTQYINNLDGIRVRADVGLIENNKEIFCENGEVLFRKYGLSGIVVFNMSRFVNPKKKQLVTIDLLPELSYKELCENLHKRFMQHTKHEQQEAQIMSEDLLAGMVLPRVAQSVANQSLSKTVVMKKHLNQLAKGLKNLTFTIEKIAQSENCQIIRGGISINCINPQTMECLLCKELYFAGEAIDIDGPCGGYNLHWAWTSGLLAGFSAI